MPEFNSLRDIFNEKLDTYQQSQLDFESITENRRTSSFVSLIGKLADTELDTMSDGLLSYVFRAAIQDKKISKDVRFPFVETVGDTLLKRIDEKVKQTDNEDERVAFQTSYINTYMDIQNFRRS